MGLFSFIKDHVAGHVATADEIRQRIVESAHDVQNLMVVADATSGRHVAVVYGFVPDPATRERIVVEVGNMAGVDAVEDRLSVGAPAAAPAPSALASQATPPAGPRPPLAPGRFTESRAYTVRRGDSLSTIAEATLGSADRGGEIFALNQPMLKSPDRIFPGQVLRLPKA